MHRSPPSARLHRALAPFALLALALLLTGCPSTDAPSFTGAPATLALEARVGGSVSDFVSVENTGSSPIVIDVTANAPWLAVVPRSLPLGPGERGTVAVTASCDAVANDGASIDLAAGTTVRTVSVDRTCTPAPVGAYDIRVETFGSGFTADIEAVFDAAAERWEEIVLGDVQQLTIGVDTDSCSVSGSVPNRNGVTIDDLLIDAVIEPIDGPGGILGSAGPCVIRSSASSDPLLSAYGTMRFDSADVAGLIAAGTFPSVILHEMGHVLGIGTLWEEAGLLDYSASPPDDPCRLAGAFTLAPTFVGPEATAVWNDDLGGTGGVPAENEYGAGTQCGHWDEEIFGNELMTGFLSGTTQPLSDLTVASLEDLGYSVDRFEAEPYALPACSPECLRAEPDGFALAGREILLLPRFEVGPDGVTRELGVPR